jgi:hypothetical protein
MSVGGGDRFWKCYISNEGTLVFACSPDEWEGLADPLDTLKFRGGYSETYLPRYGLGNDGFRGHAGIGDVPGMKYIRMHSDVDVNSRGQLGATALHEAVLGRSVRAIEYLLKLGVDKSVVDDFGQTPLELAREMEYGIAVSLLK